MHFDESGKCVQVSLRKTKINCGELMLVLVRLNVTKHYTRRERSTQI